MAYIYKIVNKINNKVYIGKTELAIQKRFQQHLAESTRTRSKNRPLYRAINKYGKENFYIELIEETDVPEEREIYWIAHFNSFQCGYNATQGGDGRAYLDYSLIEDTYLTQRCIKTTANILHISADTVSKVLNQRGLKLSLKEVCTELTGRKIKMLSLDNQVEKIFNSVHEASQYLKDNNFTPTTALRGIGAHLKECANGTRKTAYKKIWKWLDS